MMTMSKGALASDQAETYFSEHYSRDDYYSQGQTTVGRWIGKSADALGLTADVSRNDFSALLQGINPRDGRVFIQAATHNGEHRAGWDATFLAPKSVSIQALIGNDSRLIAAHKQAVERALIEVEAYAMSRQHGGRDYVVSGNVIGARFDHFAARQVDPSNAPDPHLHTHVVLLNATQRPDGQWRSLDPVEIYRAQRFGSAVYRSELARHLQAVGYRIEVSKGDGAWELLRRLSRSRTTGDGAGTLAPLHPRRAGRDYHRPGRPAADSRGQARSAAPLVRTGLPLLGTGALLQQDARPTSRRR
jgi:conjugative relaxase-like TrwC/TraI family protein